MKELIKKIRDLTGAGFTECKKAAEESNNNLDSALEILKKKGIARAAKKIANEVEHGSVLIESDNFGNVVVLNFKSQTDFAIKSDAFCKFVENEANFLLKSSSDSIKDIVHGNESFQDRLSFFVSTLGENVVLNACKKFIKKDGIKYVTYLHNKINSDFNNIALLGVVLTVNEDANDDSALKLAKHAAASDSLILSDEQITEEMFKDNPEIKDCVLLKQQFFYDDAFTVKEFADKNLIKIFAYDLFIA